MAMMGKIARETEYQGLRVAVCEDGTLWGKRTSEDWREIMVMYGATPIYVVQPRWLGPASPSAEAEALAGRYPDRGGDLHRARPAGMGAVSGQTQAVAGIYGADAMGVADGTGVDGII